MNHYVTLTLTNRKSSVHLHALYSPHTALRMFKPRRDHLMVCLLYKVLVGKAEGKRPLWRPRRRCEDEIRMDLGEIGWGCGVDSVGSGYVPVVVCCEYGDEPSGSGATELIVLHMSWSRWPRSLRRRSRPFGYWDRGLESHLMHGC
jgi:hypothetical protein